MEAIRFENVHFSYRNEETDGEDVFNLDASFSLDGIDLSVREGEFVAILGHNGSGKSTLARLTNGLLMPSQGEITVLGLDVGEEKNLFKVRKQVGIVFQNPDNQTVASIVEDDIVFGPENVGVPREEIGKRVEFALQAVGMSEYRYSSTSRLSGGQKQRIAIAGVLALKPRIMILDESTAMLDPRGRKEVIDVVARLNREEKITVILITHFPEEALLADRAIVMNHGKIVAEGVPADVLKNEKELLDSSLTLPRGIRICKRLRDVGIAIEDAFEPEGVAEGILRDLEVKQRKGETDVIVGAKTLKKAENEIKTSDHNEKGRVFCRNLSYVYNPASPFATHALKEVNLDILPGEFFGVIGHTGSGKSTFVQHLNALIKLPTAEKKYKAKRVKDRISPERTMLFVDGFDLTRKGTNFKELRRRVGMVFQYPEHQLFAETVFEDVAFGLKNFCASMSEKEIFLAVKEAVQTVGLNFEEVKNRSPFELSGGQRRRVAIAGVIVTKPEILVLDEPAAGLDPLGKEEILSLLHKIHKEWCKTVIIVSHDMDEIAENCTSAAIFSEGKILAVSTPKKLFATEKFTLDAGLELPFIAKVLKILHYHGVEIDCDLTMEDFVEKTAEYVKTGGTGMRLSSEGGPNA